MSKSILHADTLDAAVLALRSPRFTCAEFMYRPRPDDPRTRAVFDFALRSRWSQLDPRDAVLLIADSAATIDSLVPLSAEFRNVRVISVIVNPADRVETPPDDPVRYGWESAGTWRRVTITDRWARILYALDAAARLDMEGWLVMPAHDAVWGAGLLDRLARVSLDHARGGVPAAVSPYTYWQHSLCPVAEIERVVIDLLNTALSRDVWMWRRLERGEIQGFWGKMGILPYRMCGAVRENVDTGIWEDDLEIDRVIHKIDYGVRGVWVFDSTEYRQLLPVFDRDGVKRVITRLLHYSLPSVSTRTWKGGSQMLQPLDRWGELRRMVSPRYRQMYPLAQALIDECWTEIIEQVKTHGASWVDWGAYRYVTRPGDPDVEVWRLSR